MSLAQKAAEYLQVCRRTGNEARWFSVQLAGHAWKDVAASMSTYSKEMDNCVSQILRLHVPNADEQQRQQLQDIFANLDKQFHWYDQHKRSAKQMEKELQKACKGEPADPAPKAKAKAKAKGKAKGKARA